MVGKFRHDDENLSSAKKLDGSNQSGYQSPTALSLMLLLSGSGDHAKCKAMEAIVTRGCPRHAALPAYETRSDFE